MRLYICIVNIISTEREERERGERGERGERREREERERRGRGERGETGERELWICDARRRHIICKQLSQTRKHVSLTHVAHTNNSMRRML